MYRRSYSILNKSFKWQLQDLPLLPLMRTLQWIVMTATKITLGSHHLQRIEHFTEMADTEGALLKKGVVLKITSFLKIFCCLILSARHSVELFTGQFHSRAENHNWRLYKLFWFVFLKLRKFRKKGMADRVFSINQRWISFFITGKKRDFFFSIFWNCCNDLCKSALKKFSLS